MNRAAIERRRVLAGVFLMTAMTMPALAQRNTGMVRTERTYPGSDRATSALVLERYTPAEVRRGDEFTYELRVTNLTRSDIPGVLVTEQFPAGFTVRSIVPEPTRRDGARATWEIPVLRPNTALTVQVLGNTNQSSPLTWCADVAFSTQICASTTIVEPALQLVKTAPFEVTLCDDIPMRLTVTNTGSGVARNVKITDTLPAGLTTTDGRNGVVFDAGDLAAGQSREFTFAARANATGEFRNAATAREDGGLAAEASSITRVRRPILQLSKYGPDTRYLGRPATFELTLRNAGDAPAANTMIVDTLPAGLQFVTADNGGQFAGGRVTWNVGTLAPGDFRTVSVTVNPTQRGIFENTAIAKAYCAEASAAAPLDVRGVAAILLEVVDVSDPIEVGADETYIITVTNQGTAPDNNIVIECTLPPEMDFVSAQGPGGVTHTATGKTVRFSSFPSLAPKARIEYRVVTKGTGTGDLRFRTVLTSDVLQSPVEETESTHVY